MPNFAPRPFDFRFSDLGGRVGQISPKLRDLLASRYFDPGIASQETLNTLASLNRSSAGFFKTLQYPDAQGGISAKGNQGLVSRQDPGAQAGAVINYFRRRLPEIIPSSLGSTNFIAEGFVPNFVEAPGMIGKGASRRAFLSIGKNGEENVFKTPHKTGSRRGEAIADAIDQQTLSQRYKKALAPFPWFNALEQKNVGGGILKQPLAKGKRLSEVLEKAYPSDRGAGREVAERSKSGALGSFQKFFGKLGLPYDSMGMAGNILVPEEHQAKVVEIFQKQARYLYAKMSGNQGGGFPNGAFNIIDYAKGFVPNFVPNFIKATSTIGEKPIPKQFLRDLASFNKESLSPDIAETGSFTKSGKLTIYRGSAGKSAGELDDFKVFEPRKIDKEKAKENFLKTDAGIYLSSHQNEGDTRGSGWRESGMVSATTSEKVAQSFGNASARRAEEARLEAEEMAQFGRLGTFSSPLPQPNDASRMEIPTGIVGSQELSVSRLVNKKALQKLNKIYGAEQTRAYLLRLTKLGGGRGVGFDANSFTKEGRFLGGKEIAVLSSGFIPKGMSRGFIPNFASGLVPNFKKQTGLKKEKLSFKAGKRRLVNLDEIDAEDGAERKERQEFFHGTRGVQRRTMG